VRDDANVTLLRDEVAIIAYNVHEELTVEGRPVALDAADASTWVRRGGRWVCALHTESIAGDPFGRDRKPAEQPAPRAERSAPDDERAIRDFIDTWISASEADDLPKVLSLMADDVVFMVPGREPFGKEEFEKNARAMRGRLHAVAAAPEGGRRLAARARRQSARAGRAARLKLVNRGVDLTRE
jgi:hypothetical protein